MEALAVKAYELALTDAAQRLDRLEAENAELRRQLIGLSTETHGQ